ncbi:flagellar hook protein FlgE [Anaerosinus massiliensis]|uniref:flagellar hook protein FlgE n=1 Tax=Massilibacillus massiliensis TaxID=1806837 RepID=UPI000B172330|nr:flagellar hook-basal body complex protein [Massilibacillus massiliensis]
MMRSLFSGVSGLKNHQTRMDVIGDNIANVNTTGFKGSRATFQDILSQTITGASSPQGNLGGTNAKQIGLGVGLASIDANMTDGSVQSTGYNTDLCLSGSGFFMVANGGNTFYTRDGSFRFDENGNYVNSGGLKVQGWMADETGTINSNAGVTDILVPVGQTMAAKATTEVKYSKNLSADASNGTTITAGLTKKETIKNLGLASGTADYTAVDGLASGSTITLSDGTTKVSYDGTNYTTTVVNTKDTATTGLTKANVLENLGIATGSADEAIINNLDTLTKSITLSNGATVAYDAASGKYTVTTPNLTNANVMSKLGLSSGTDFDNINNLTPGDPSITLSDGSVIEYLAGGTYTLTQSNLTQSQVMSNLGLSAGSSDYKLVDGMDTITLSDGMTQVSYDGIGKTYTTIAKADTAVKVVASVAAYDSQGVKHTITGTFTKSKNNNEWTFSPGTATDTGCTISGGTGTITFDENGKYLSSTVSALTFKPSDAGLGGATTTLTLDFSSLTQYEGDSAIAVDKDGNTAGSLESVSLDSSGTIVGSFSNGLKKNLAQVALATFNNPAGLTKSGTSLYSVSNNSGDPQISSAGTGGAGTLTPSSLEMSNVNLSEQFSDMIITQRGFQSNSKIITVSDEMLETLVNLKR